jgi:hypothetical protein
MRRGRVLYFSGCSLGSSIISEGFWLLTILDPSIVESAALLEKEIRMSI